MLSISEAILKISEIHDRGIREGIGRVEVGPDDAQQIVGRGLQALGLPEFFGSRLSLFQSGPVYVYAGMVQRGIKPCPICGAMTGMGSIVVVHQDGRAVSFDPALYHYADAGHPITADDVDVETLVAIVSEA